MLSCCLGVRVVPRVKICYWKGFFFDVEGTVLAQLHVEEQGCSCECLLAAHKQGEERVLHTK
jgi:hypothetical protein